MAELLILCQQTVFRYQMDYPVVQSIRISRQNHEIVVLQYLSVAVVCGAHVDAGVVPVDVRVDQFAGDDGGAAVGEMLAL